MEIDDAKYHAVQTAILATIVKTLINSKIVERRLIVEDLHELLMEFNNSGGLPYHGGAIKHILHLIDREDDVLP